MRRSLVVLALSGAVLVAGCSGGGADGPVEIVSATWSQSQAIEGFDSTPGETTDTADLDELEEIIETYDLQGDVRLGEQCDGGRTTDLSYLTEGGDEFHIRVEGCDEGDAGSAIDDLVSEWRTGS